MCRMVQREPSFPPAQLLSFFPGRVVWPKPSSGRFGPCSSSSRNANFLLRRTAAHTGPANRGPLCDACRKKKPTRSFPERVATASFSAVVIPPPATNHCLEIRVGVLHRLLNLSARRRRKPAYTPPRDRQDRPRSATGATAVRFLRVGWAGYSPIFQQNEGCANIVFIFLAGLW